MTRTHLVKRRKNKRIAKPCKRRKMVVHSKPIAIKTGGKAPRYSRTRRDNWWQEVASVPASGSPPTPPLGHLGPHGSPYQYAPVVGEDFHFPSLPNSYTSASSPFQCKDFASQLAAPLPLGVPSLLGSPPFPLSVGLQQFPIEPPSASSPPFYKAPSDFVWYPSYQPSSPPFSHDFWKPQSTAMSGGSPPILVYPLNIAEQFANDAIQNMMELNALDFCRQLLPLSTFSDPGNLTASDSDSLLAARPSVFTVTETKMKAKMTWRHSKQGLRGSTSKSQSPSTPHCIFCKNNKETREFYQSHILKTREGHISCPILRKYTCPICNATGDQAHTLRYCPKNEEGPRIQQRTRSLSLPSERSLGLRNSVGVVGAYRYV